MQQSRCYCKLDEIEWLLLQTGWNRVVVIANWMQQSGCYCKLDATEWLLLQTGCNRVIVIANWMQQSSCYCKLDATEWLLLQTGCNRVVVIANWMQQSGCYCKLDETEWLLLQTYCPLNMFRAPLCPSSGAQELMMGIRAAKTCWADSKFAITTTLLHPVGLLFPRINDDARSNSHQEILHLVITLYITVNFWSRTLYSW